MNGSGKIKEIGQGKGEYSKIKISRMNGAGSP